MPALRKYATASAQVYNVANGDPIMTDYGYAQLDVLRKSHKGGQTECTVNGIPKLQFIDDYGMTNRPFVNPINMRLSQHICTPSGSWEELTSTGGLAPVYHLKMFDNSPGIIYSCRSNYNLSANPCFAVSLIFPDSPENWDYTTMEPYTRIEFGNGMFGVVISKQYGRFLLRNVGGIWVHVADIKGGDGTPSQLGDDEHWVFIRCENGKVLISMDFGQEYTAYENPDLTPVSVPAGPWRVVGQGGIIAVGIGELVPNTATYAAPPSNTFEIRSSFTTPIISGRYNYPAEPGASINFTDLSQPAFRSAQWAAQFVPTLVQTFPFRMWHSPVLHNVTLRYPFQRITTSGAFTTPWDAWLLEASVSKPKKLAESTCSLLVHRNAYLDPALEDEGPMRWRKVRVRAGFVMDDGTTQMFTVFTGYIKSISEDRSRPGEVHSRVELVNLAYMLKRDKWLPTQVVSFAGITPQEVGDYVLKSKGLMDEAGLDRTYANWFTASLGTPPLSPGKWDEPFETIKPNESKWASIERIFGYYGFEIGVTDDGALISIPENYVSPTIDWDLYAGWDGVSLEDISKQVTTASHTMSSEESCTMVVVYGKLDNDQLAMFIAVDTVAETDATNARFSPIRDLYLEEFGESHGAPDAPIMAYKTSLLAQRLFGLRKDMLANFPIEPSLSRKAGIALHGFTSIGIPEAAKFCLETHSIRVSIEETIGTLTSSAGLRRV